MKYFRVWDHGWLGVVEVDGTSPKEELARKFPNEEIHIQGEDFEPISQGAHYAAAGWAHLLAEMSDFDKQEPAHFNRLFFREQKLQIYKLCTGFAFVAAESVDHAAQLLGNPRLNADDVQHLPRGSCTIAADMQDAGDLIERIYLWSDTNGAGCIPMEKLCHSSCSLITLKSLKTMDYHI